MKRERDLGPGPWASEPDRVEFDAHGFPCLIVRHPSMGHLCGYVAVPPGHPWHGKNYNDVRVGEDEYPDVHGGLTYASKCQGEICHVPTPGQSDDVWWLGFDAAHSGDYSPATGVLLNRGPYVCPIGVMSEVYKTVEYMRAECERLAEQARKAAP